MPSNDNYLCPYCLKVLRWRCPIHPTSTLCIGSRPRVPKKSASKFRWKQFFNRFPQILRRLPDTKKLNKLNLKKR